MKNNLHIIILLLLFSKNIFPQNYIFDYNNNPVPHAHVYYTGVDGFMSNEDGLFNLSEDMLGDTLYISHVSYKSKKVLVSGISKGDTIFIESAKISLEEVIVSSVSAKTLVARAINKIKDNYMQSSYNLYGFFRQSLQEDSTGVEMTEVDFVSYVKNKTSTYNTKILKARRTKNFAKLNIETHSGQGKRIIKPPNTNT